MGNYKCLIEKDSKKRPKLNLKCKGLKLKEKQMIFSKKRE